MAISINDLVLKLVQDNPNWSNDQVAEEVQRRIPGATTSGASVSSVKSKARKGGLLSEASSAAMTSGSTYFDEEPAVTETEEERSLRIRKRYNTLSRMANRVANGQLPSLIVSGPPGLGKSYTVEEQLALVHGTPDESNMDGTELGYDIIAGTISAPMLYMALYNQRDGGVVVLDDCDDVFRDETSLNILKAVLDSSAKRIVSYRKMARWMEENDVPTTFEFKGSVVFCTNIDFEREISKGTAMANHFQALIDRSLYLSLTVRTKADFITRVRHVAIEDGMLVKQGLEEEQAAEVMQFVVDNMDRFYSLSLRLIGQIATCYMFDPENWSEDIEATKMRTLR